MGDPLTIIHGDALSSLRRLADESVQCCVTSPPYWGLRDYGIEGQLGLEKTPEEYVARLVEIFCEVRRVLRKDGTLWLNLGDSYNAGRNGGHAGGTKTAAIQQVDERYLQRSGPNVSNLKPKDLIGIPWRVAFALQSDGWYLRSDIIWAKKNCMPESVKDRPTRSHEYIFLLSKSEKYYYNAEAIAEPIADASIERLGRGVSGDHKNTDGAPGQAPHSLHEARSNINTVMRPGENSRFFQDRDLNHNGKRKPPRFGGDKSAGLTPRYSGKPWEPNCLHEQLTAANENRDFSERFSGIMRNKRDVWTIATSPFPEAHFATFPKDLVIPCILAGSKPGDVVIDPFAGSFTTCKVAIELGRRAIGIEPKAEYVEMGRRRCETTIGLPLHYEPQGEAVQAQLDAQEDVPRELEPEDCLASR